MADQKVMKRTINWKSSSRNNKIKGVGERCYFSKEVEGLGKPHSDVRLVFTKEELVAKGKYIRKLKQAISKPSMFLASSST
ncbi:hypothetical protein TNCT_525411 [Trichonephila clavata]|uniref:Uncharacterized protein n=1 Tax=Trichonephila clavata TaxID=2740835 RepID=A0A8X6K7K7_TRICU|nr:hypothetical protein TNCT_525411 [Trichonephila clavata]